MLGRARFENNPHDADGGDSGSGRRLVIEAPEDGLLRVSDDPTVTTRP